MNYAAFCLTLIAGIFVLGGCDFLSSKSTEEKREIESATDEGSIPIDDIEGATTYDVSVSSAEEAILGTSEESAVSGAELSIPPGSLSIDQQITLEEGNDLADPITVAELGIQSDVQSASGALMISSTETDEASADMELSLPLNDGAAFRLATDKYAMLAILYRITRKDGTLRVGIISRDQINIDLDSKQAKVKIRYFGVYQAVILTVAIEKSVSVETEIGYSSVRETKERSTGKWSNTSAIVTADGLLKYSSEISEFKKERCGIIIDRDKESPFDIRAYANNLIKQTAPAESGTYFAQFRCQASDGFMSSRSPWTKGLSYTKPAGATDEVNNDTTTTSSPKHAELSISFTPPGAVSQSFGNSAVKTMVLSNTGNAEATSLIFSAVSFPFSISGNTCANKLAVSASCSVNVTFKSPGAGTYPLTVSVNYFNGQETDSVSLSFTAEGTGAPEVQPVYPINGDSWNDYIRVTDHSAAIHMQTDTACSGAETGPRACVHAGELLKVVNPLDNSCTDLEASDALGIFQWICDDSSGYTVFYSGGMKQKKLLMDAIDTATDSWHENSVIIRKNGSIYLETDSTVWWNNTISALPDNSNSATTGVASLTTPGGVYYLDESRATGGYSIEADGVAITMPVDKGFTWNFDINNCNVTTGEVAAPDGRCMITSGGQKFLWLEGSYSGMWSSANYANIGINLASTNFSRIRNCRLSQFDKPGIFLNSSSNNRIFSCSLSFTGQTLGAILVSVASNDNVINQILSYGHGENGIAIKDSFRNIITDINVMGGGIPGLYAGLRIEDSFQTTVNHVSILDHEAVGLFLGTAGTQTDHFATISNVLAANAASSGLTLYNTDSNRFANLALFSNNAANSTGHNWNVVTGGSITDTFVLHNFLVDDVNTCTSNAGISAGCSASGGGGTTTTGLDLSSSFVGAVSDSQNPDDDSNGQVPFNSLSLPGLVAFENPWRGWTILGSGFPSPDERGPCASGDTCQIFDLRISSGDTQLLNKAGDGSTTEVFIDAAACPAGVYLSLVDYQSYEFIGDGSGDDDGICEATEPCIQSNAYLINAREKMFDGVGDDDTLCESGEDCLAATTIGGYYGHSNADGECLFADGTYGGESFGNIKMYFYSIFGG